MNSIAALLNDAAGTLTGLVLGAVAGVRRGKAVHPKGVVHRARLVVPGSSHAPQGAELLAKPAAHGAIVRFSRSVGLPRPLPDLLGISIRVLDCYGLNQHQDLLVVTSANLPVIHHVFLPAGDVQQRPYSSSLPFRAGDDLFLVGMLPSKTSPRPQGGDELDRLGRAAATGQLHFNVAVAPVFGRFRAVATLEVGERLPQGLDALRFDPFKTGGGLENAGWINGLRRRAYPMSQASWRFARRDGYRVQDEAERLLQAELGRNRRLRQPDSRANSTDHA
ncbi:MAG: hypothetical protein M3P40_00605 [Actinomycetota bacterium]|nr:hypothetical protein [Actinomycetota bacterium]